MVFWSILTTVHVNGFGTLCHQEAKQYHSANVSALAPNTKVVILGDQGLGSSPVKVLNDILQWKPDVVIHNGDFDYTDNPTNWENQLTSVVGADYPYFVDIGNHDVYGWKLNNNGYYQKALARFQRLSGATCEGEYGVNFGCEYKGLVFVLSGVGTQGSDHVNFIDSYFKQHKGIWKFCGWHKNQHLMQTGDKTDETGWGVYEICREHGAIVTTGHEHSYARTHAMSSFTSQIVASTADPVVSKYGQTWAVVSGLGGIGIRAWKNNLEKNPWWAKAAASDNGVGFGALYCTLYINDDPRAGHCDFKDVNGKIWDSFNIRSELDPAADVHTTAAQCPDKVGRFIEMPILNSDHDGAFDENGLLSTRGTKLSAHGHNFFHFKFTHHTKDLENIEYAALQIYGAVGGCGLKMTIESMDGVGPLVEWNAVPEDLEKHEVWVSPNIAPLVTHILANTTRGTGGDVHIRVRGVGPNQHCDALFYSHDESPCLAPTLVVQYKPNPTAC